MYFYQRGILRKQSFNLVFWVCCILAFIGAMVLLSCSPETQAKMTPWLLLSVLVLTFVMPGISSKHRYLVSHTHLCYGIIIPLIALYVGFFGPAGISFFLLALLYIAGKESIDALAHARLYGLACNITAFCIFAYLNLIHWEIAIAMGIGQWIGAWLGSYMAFLKGSRLIRPCLCIVACLLMSKFVYNSLFQTPL